MVILIRKKQIFSALGFCLCLLGMGAILWHGQPDTAACAVAPAQAPRPVLVIDPGHGGEDGGAVADDGTAESGVNLAVSLRLREILTFAGRETVMTRDEDVMLNDEGLATMRERKVSDLKNRVRLVNETPGAVLVSIHQNALPGMPSVHGAQVFYNGVPGGEGLAKAVQERLNQTVNTERAKVCKRIPDTIYLMKQVTVPAVLVECGFLSSPQETDRLKTTAHQTRLAVTIAAGLLAGEGGESPALDTAQTTE